MSSSSKDTSTTSSIDVDGERWSALAARGVEHYRAGEDLEALAYWAQALNLLTAIEHGTPPCHGLLIARIVTHQNRAASLRRLEHFDAADLEDSLAFEHMRAHAEDPKVPGSVRIFACGHAAQVFAEWRRFRDDFSGAAPAQGDAHASPLSLV